MLLGSTGIILTVILLPERRLNSFLAWMEKRRITCRRTAMNARNQFIEGLLFNDGHFILIFFNNNPARKYDDTGQYKKDGFIEQTPFNFNEAGADQ